MNPTPSKVIGKEDFYELKVFLGYQKILDPKNIQIFYEKKNK